MIYTRVRSVSESCKILSLTSKSRVGILWDPDDPAAAIAFNEDEAVAFSLNPDCAVKDLWSKEREKKDNRSSGLG
jgi:hypothetical protein